MIPVYSGGHGGEEMIHPVNWGDELGIDLEALMLERFHCTAHIKLAKIHKKRVARFEQFNRWVAFERHLDEAGQQWRDRETLRGARIREAKQPEEYDFSDEVLDIAERSLDAQDSVRALRV